MRTKNVIELEKRLLIKRFKNENPCMTYRDLAALFRTSSRVIADALNKSVDEWADYIARKKNVEESGQERLVIARKKNAEELELDRLAICWEKARSERTAKSPEHSPSSLPDRRYSSTIVIQKQPEISNENIYETYKPKILSTSHFRDLRLPIIQVIKKIEMTKHMDSIGNITNDTRRMTSHHE